MLSYKYPIILYSKIIRAFEQQRPAVLDGRVVRARLLLGDSGALRALRRTRRLRRALEEHHRKCKGLKYQHLFTRRTWYLKKTSSKGRGKCNIR